MTKPNLDKLKKKQKETILKYTEDAVHNLLYHDRAEDKEISSALIFELLGSKDITTSEIINAFAKELRKETT